MRWKQHIPAVPGSAIALSAMLLGFMVAIALAPYLVIPRSRVYGIDLSTALFVAISFCADAVIVLLAWKFLADRQSRTDRDLLNAFLEHIPDNVYFKDRESRFLRIGNAMAQYFGLDDPACAINKTDSDIFSSEHASQALTDEQKIIRTGEPIVGLEEKETWPDGRESWTLTTKMPLIGHRGKIIGTMGISRNITDQKQAEARIRYMALHDALTGLPNRALLQDRLAQGISLAHRNKKQVGVLMLDLDRFKNVNDSFGHYVGDRLLEAVAKRLKSCVRESDIVARLGGDEFVIGLLMVHDQQDVERVAQKILTALADPVQVEGHDLQISASIGICLHPQDGDNAEALLQTADAAMYESKKKGRGVYSFFTPELTVATRRKQKLERDLQQACGRGELVLFYQPLVVPDLGRVTGVEALLRWRHPELGMISPSEFIPQMEELGLMVEIGRWVLKSACRQNIAWQRQGLPPVRVAVNLSAQQFYRGDIVGTVQRVLHETGLDPKWLELEITESITLDDTEATIRILGELKHLGISLSLDDFGTGWSSLSYLRRFPLDRIKIDRSFMRDLESQPAAEAVVRSVLNLGRDLGLACTAEGVETPQQLEYLQKQMCAEIQGFLFCPAVSAEDCAALLRSPKSDTSTDKGARQTAATAA
jgi:diguanylate cyclase (GGDEF)-like protein/PAS domain S-box-containing protein